MFRVAKCCSRCGDKDGAVAGLERLLYNHNFWDERYSAAAALRLERDGIDALVRNFQAMSVRRFQGVCWQHWLMHHDKANQDKAAATIQGLARGKKARAMVKEITMDRQAQERLTRFVNDVGNSCLKKRYLRRLAKQVVVNRRDRAATTIQAMARGVEGRETASDERKRRSRIDELLRMTLRRLGEPVFREWRNAARDIRRVRAATKIQARWRTHRARQDWLSTKKQIARALEMGHRLNNRNTLRSKRLAVENWKHAVLERKTIAVQRQARLWLAKRRLFRLKTQQRQARELLMRVMKPIRRQCFVALIRNKNARRKECAAASVAIQSHVRRHLAISHAKKAREYRILINNAYEVVSNSHQRRLLARCCLEWKENAPKHKAAGRIQALWRGEQGRVLVALTRDRADRFEKVAGVPTYDSRDSFQGVGRAVGVESYSVQVRRVVSRPPGKGGILQEVDPAQNAAGTGHRRLDSGHTLG
eukprot:jgi/Undpi1/10861/HiC_scaffold_3.g01387.m1